MLTMADMAFVLLFMHNDHHVCAKRQQLLHHYQGRYTHRCVKEFKPISQVRLIYPPGQGSVNSYAVRVCIHKQGSLCPGCLAVDVQWGTL